MHKSLPLAPARPWSWVPTLYLAEGIPYVAVTVLSTIMYKRLGLSNTDLALYTSWLYLPWVIKPLWSPVVDAVSTKRRWVTWMQALFVLCLVACALSLLTPWWLVATLASFWLLAFASATHDVAADGLYILSLSSHEQAFFVGVRSTFYRIATIVTQGLLVYLAGIMEQRISVPVAWMTAFLLMAAVFVLLTAWHAFALPRREPSAAGNFHFGNTLRQFWLTVKTFFSKPQLLPALLFMLLFRLPEALLTKMASPFLLDSHEAGGLALTTAQVGIVYGTVGIVALTLGGLLGGFLVARYGLRRMMWWLVMAISLPDLVYVYLSLLPTSNLPVICTCIGIEQLGYGIGFTAYMLYLVYFARGESATSVYALCTAFMALGMMLPGMAAGWLADHLGYAPFFLLTCVLCAVTCLVSALVKVDPQFGRKERP